MNIPELVFNGIVFKRGLRVYYTGDMANDGGFGTVKNIDKTNYGNWIKIKFDDGRNISVNEYQFSKEFKGNGSTRFVTLSAYNEFREKQYNYFISRRLAK